MAIRLDVQLMTGSSNANAATQANLLQRLKHIRKGGRDEDFGSISYDFPDYVSQIYIGRAKEVNIIVNNGLVSRWQCVISKDDKGYRVEDLDSRNGTQVNNDKVLEDGIYLKDGDDIYVGISKITFYDLDKLVDGPVEVGDENGTEQ